MVNENVANADVQKAIRVLLSAIGEDPTREGLQGTPARMERMYAEICAGYSMNLEEVVHGAIFHEAADGMIIVNNIRFFSLCEHHMLPFWGYAQVAYIPNGTIIGLSKIPRIVEMYSRRLQVQERLTAQIAESLDEILHPKGVAVSLTAEHMCAMMRGVQKECKMTTEKYSGYFSEDESLRREFLMKITDGR